MICLAQETSSSSFISSPHVLTAAASESGDGLTFAPGDVLRTGHPAKRAASVQGDVNGDGKADFEIYVKVGALGSGDFLL